MKEYWHSVFEPFLRDFDEGGATPNPDLACNRHIKFGALLEHCSRSLGADLLATGHYARIVQTDAMNPPRLLRGFDPDKDQSYFLASVMGESLRRACFPLGGLTKREVREIAAGPANLPAAVTHRRSSAGICFIGRKRDFGDFIQEYLPAEGETRWAGKDRREEERAAGSFISAENGEAVGRHGGLARYTCGQRARLGGAAVPWYVVGKDSRGGSNGPVYVAPGADHPALFTTSAAVDRCFWVSGARPRGMDTEHGARLSAQTRYGARAVSCSARTIDIRSAVSSLVPSAFCTPPDLDEVLRRTNSGVATTTADWWESADPKKYFFSFPYQNDETPLFYLRKLRVPLALRGSQNPKVEGPLARCPSFPVRKSRRSSDTSQLPRKKFTTPSDPIVDQTPSPTPDDAGALIFQNLR